MTEIMSNFQFNEKNILCSVFDQVFWKLLEITVHNNILFCSQRSSKYLIKIIDALVSVNIQLCIDLMSGMNKMLMSLLDKQMVVVSSFNGYINSLLYYILDVCLAKFILDFMPTFLMSCATNIFGFSCFKSSLTQIYKKLAMECRKMNRLRTS